MDFRSAKEGNNLARVAQRLFLHDRFRRPAGERDRSGVARGIHHADRPVRIVVDGARNRTRDVCVLFEINARRVNLRHLKTSHLNTESSRANRSLANS